MRLAILALLLAACGGGGGSTRVTEYVRCGYFLAPPFSGYVPGFTITLVDDSLGGPAISRTLEDEWGYRVTDADDDTLAEWIDAWAGYGGDFDCEAYEPADVADLSTVFDYSVGAFVTPEDMGAFLLAHRSGILQ